MPEYSPSNAKCLVFTYKEGLLSKAAHDLKIEVTDFSITVDEASNSIVARGNASSLRVVCPMKDGQDNPGGLNDSDRKKIEDEIVKEVLHAKKFGEIGFTSTSITEVGGDFDIAGMLSLHGVEKPISFKAKKLDGRLVAEIPIHQPDFGIKPYSAMMGTLKVKPELRVCFSAPA